MKTQKLVIAQILFLFLGLILLSGCDREETLQPIEIFEVESESTNELDVYLKENFRDPYGSNIIYKFVDRYVDPTKQVVPPRIDVVKPIAELLQTAWIAPFNKAADDGDAFLKTYFPGEIVLLGSPIFNGDGTILLGSADSGVRITLTRANEYTPTNDAWILQTFRTIYHEFFHIVQQNFPYDIAAYLAISDGEGYTTPGTWTTLFSGGEFSAATINNAIARGMVTAYGTSQVGEDMVELISFYITTDPADFEATYLTAEDCTGAGQACLDRNEGRQLIQEKLDFIKKYLKEDVGLDLDIIREEFLNSIN